MLNIYSSRKINIFNKIKSHSFSKHISYPFIPVICFESSCKCYVDNPYLKRIGYKAYPDFLCCLNKSYEGWSDWSKKALIRDEKIASYIIKESRNFIERNEKIVCKLESKGHESSENEIIDLLDEIDSLMIGLYHLYIFFIDESFELEDKKTNKILPEIRIKLSDFSSRLYDLCFVIIDLISSKFPNIHKKSFSYATIGEIKDLLRHRIDHNYFKKIKSRPILFITAENKQFVFVNKDALELKEHIRKHDPSKNDGAGLFLLGSVAQKGKVSGRVIKITEAYYDKIAKIIGNRKNYILVIPMTRPEMVPAIKNSIGIITDEGGITCHAAIVSRELKKPCIVGTKVATRRLKNDDIVEMDANKGIIKIIR